MHTVDEEAEDTVNSTYQVLYWNEIHPTPTWRAAVLLVRYLGK